MSSIPSNPNDDSGSEADPVIAQTPVIAPVDAVTEPEHAAEPEAEPEAPSEPVADGLGEGDTAADTAADTEATAEAAADGSTAAAPAAPARPAASPNEIAQRLKSLFPALFTGAPKPIKLRVQQDIQERAPGQFTKQELSIFFRRFTRSTSYLHALSRATQRFDLDGQPAGEVSEEHRTAAAEEARQRRTGQDERRELEEQQRRNRAGLLHDFEITTLTRANFCVLKGVVAEELDGLLDIARRERAERPPERVVEPRDQRDHRDQRPRNDRGPSDRPRGPRPEARSDRPDARGAPPGQRRR